MSFVLKFPILIMNLTTHPKTKINQKKNVAGVLI